jgi:cobalt-zinc-cadmium efflux system outer membrane protein
MKKVNQHTAVLTILMLFLSVYGFAQQLESYIVEAANNNPEIKAFELRYAIADEKVNELNTLPNTEISAGYFVSEPETRTGAQVARFSIRQMIPWFGTITARENYATSMADAEYVEIAIAKRKLSLAVSQSYYKLYGLKASQKVLEENIQLLETYKTLALNSVEVGNASAVDVLKLQIRQNDLKQQIEVLLQSYAAEQNMFNTLLNKEENAIITVVDSLGLPSEFIDNTQANLELHPELLKYDKLFESVNLSESVNQRELRPNLGFGLDYIPVAERPDMSFSDNGKDIIMPMVSLTIPIFNTKYKSVTKQNELKQQEITSQKEARKDKLQNLLQSAIYTQTASRLTYLTQAENLKQAKNAEEILLKNYETGVIDFNDVLDIQELQLMIQMKGIEAIKNYYLQTAIINYIAN